MVRTAPILMNGIRGSRRESVNKRGDVLKRRYAEKTEVPIERSKHEIERILNRYGADDFIYRSSKSMAGIMFRCNKWIVRFCVTLPTEEDFKTTASGRHRTIGTAAKKAKDQETRRLWRSLANGIKSKLDFVESGIVTFEESFMSHIVLPTGQTMGETFIPQMREVVNGKEIPMLTDMTGE